MTETTKAAVEAALWPLIRMFAEARGLSEADGGRIIDTMRALVAERDRFEAALARACLVGGTTYLVERYQKAEAERDAAMAGCFKVKPLEWSDGEPACATGLDVQVKGFAIPRANIEAFEADRTARILSALAPDTAAHAEVTRLREALERAAKDFENDSNLDRRVCCGGRECGCQGATVGEYVAHSLRERKGADHD